MHKTGINLLILPWAGNKYFFESAIFVLYYVQLNNPRQN